MTQKIIEEYVHINGIEQYILHLPSDSKDVVIMLHGGPGLANSYLAYFQQPYSDFCNMVYYDQRGAGKTQIKNQSTPESLSFDVLLEDLRQTISYIKNKYATDRIFLAGHSWGSMLGTEYVLKFPSDVAGYIGYGQGVPGKKQSRHYYEFVKSEVQKSENKEQIDLLSQVSDSFPDVPREDYFRQYNIIAEIGFGCGYDFAARDAFEIYANSPTWTDDDEQLSSIVEKLNEKLYAEAIYNWENNTDVYEVSVFYILGRHDEMTSSVIAAEYFDQIKAPKKGLYWIENAGHLVDTDNPADFFAAVKDILLNHYCAAAHGNTNACYE
jgi:pimeloyl-ACP methyl ester carboxylesterase